MKFLFGAALALVFQTQAFAQISTQRLQQIKALAERYRPDTLLAGIQFIENPQIPGPAWAREPSPGYYIIETNSAILNLFPESGRKFVMYHEAGHIRMGHPRWPRNTPLEKAQVEFEADAFAAHFYRRHFTVDEMLLTFLDMMTRQTHTTPPGPDRLKLILSILKN